MTRCGSGRRGPIRYHRLLFREPTSCLCPRLPHCPKPALTDRVVLVTGASGGLGRVLALACASRGATVVLHGRIVRKLEALYDEIVAAKDPEPTILPLDLVTAKADDFGNVASALQSQHGRIDGIVHTAVQLGSLGPVEHQSFDGWLATTRVNLLAPFGLTRSLLPLLRAAPRRQRGVHAGHARRGSEGVLGRVRGREGRIVGAARAFSRTSGRTCPRCASMASCRGRCARRCARKPIPGDDNARLPPPEAFAALYLYLLDGQPKEQSGGVIDAPAWLQGCERRRVRLAAVNPGPACGDFPSLSKTRSRRNSSASSISGRIASVRARRRPGA